MRVCVVLESVLCVRESWYVCLMCVCGELVDFLYHYIVYE